MSKIEQAFALYEQTNKDGTRKYTVEEIAEKLEIPNVRTVRGYVYRCRHPEQYKAAVQRYFAKKRGEEPIKEGLASIIDRIKQQKRAPTEKELRELLQVAKKKTNSPVLRNFPPKQKFAPAKPLASAKPIVRVKQKPSESGVWYRNINEPACRKRGPVCLEKNKPGEKDNCPHFKDECSKGVRKPAPANKAPICYIVQNGNVVMTREDKIPKGFKGTIYYSTFEAEQIALQ